jgi:hypothetical protein
MNEWMNKGRPKSAHALRRYLDLLCIPLCFTLPTALHFEWSVVSDLWGRRGSHLVSWNNGPGDEILNKLWPHNHIGYVWLILLSLNTFRKWDYPLTPFWKGVLSGDSVSWVVLSSIAAGFCLVSTREEKVKIQHLCRISCSSVTSEVTWLETNIVFRKENGALTHAISFHRAQLEAEVRVQLWRTRGRLEQSETQERHLSGWRNHTDLPDAPQPNYLQTALTLPKRKSLKLRNMNYELSLRRQAQVDRNRTQNCSIQDTETNLFRMQLRRLFWQKNRPVLHGRSWGRGWTTNSVYKLRSRYLWISSCLYRVTCNSPSF